MTPCPWCQRDTVPWKLEEHSALDTGEHLTPSRIYHEYLEYHSVIKIALVPNKCAKKIKIVTTEYQIYEEKMSLVEYKRTPCAEGAGYLLFFV